MGRRKSIKEVFRLKKKEIKEFEMYRKLEISIKLFDLEKNSNFIYFKFSIFVKSFISYVKFHF